MMVCPRCNSTANPEGTKYCLECGAPLSHTAPASPPPPQPVNMPLLADGGNADHMIVSDADIARRHLGGYNKAYLDGHVETLEINPAGMMGTPPAPSGGTR